MENNQINDYIVQWVVDSTLRGDKFPLVIFNKISLNVRVNTTWGASQYFLFNPTELTKANVAWVNVPETTQGNGSVFIYINDDYKGSYDVDWAKLPTITNIPTQIDYSYRWFSFWSGATLLKVNLWDNGTIHVANIIMKRTSLGINLDLYNSSFKFVKNHAINDWTEFWQPIDLTNVFKWQSWVYNTPVALCDYIGFEERGELYWDRYFQYRISFNKLVDDSTCSGGRTLHSHPEISQFFNLILKTTKEIITNHFNQKNKLTESAYYPIHAVILALPILCVIIIAKKRRKMRKIDE